MKAVLALKLLRNLALMGFMAGLPLTLSPPLHAADDIKSQIKRAQAKAKALGKVNDAAKAIGVTGAIRAKIGTAQADVEGKVEKLKAQQIEEGKAKQARNTATMEAATAESKKRSERQRQAETNERLAGEANRNAQTDLDRTIAMHDALDQANEIDEAKKMLESTETTDAEKEKARKTLSRFADVATAGVSDAVREKATKVLQDRSRTSMNRRSTSENSAKATTDAVRQRNSAQKSARAGESSGNSSLSTSRPGSMVVRPISVRVEQAPAATQNRIRAGAIRVAQATPQPSVAPAIKPASATIAKPTLGAQARAAGSGMLKKGGETLGRVTTTVKNSTAGKSLSNAVALAKPKMTSAIKRVAKAPGSLASAAKSAAINVQKRIAPKIQMRRN